MGWNRAAPSNHPDLMKLLFAIGHLGFLRNFEPVLRELATRGHRIHLVTDRRETLGGSVILERLAAEFASITLGQGPNLKTDRQYPLGTGMRLALDYWRYLDPDYSEATKLRERAARQAPAIAVKLGGLPGLRCHLGLSLMQTITRSVERSMASPKVCRELIAQHKPDAVLVTPLLYFGSQQVHYVRAAKELGVRTILCVGSWDHLTTKGLIHETPNNVLVWNEAQRQEAQRWHAVPPERIMVTGAPAYDRWFARRPSRERADFCNAVGLPDARRYLLYLCSSPFIAPEEVNFVHTWARSVRNHSHPTVRDLGIIVRPHPQNAAQWADVDLSNLGATVIWPRCGANPVDEAATADFFDSMYHCSAVLGVNTSAQIEAAIVGRPVFTIKAPLFQETQGGTLHFQHLESTSGGLVCTAQNFEEHLQQLLDSITGDQHNDRAQQFVEGFVRPRGLSRPASEVFAGTVEKLAALPPNPIRRRSIWCRMLGKAMLPLAGVAERSARRHGKRNRASSRRESRSERVLFIVGSPEYLRYFDTTIADLAKHGLHVSIGVNSQRDEKLARLESLDSHAGLVSSVGMVPEYGGVWGPIATGLRGLHDFIRYLDPRLAQASALRQRIKRKALPILFWPLDWIPSLSAKSVTRLRRLLTGFEAAIPPSQAVCQFLREIQPGIVLVSPLVDAASPQVDTVKAARALGLPVGLCVASWDNLSNKGCLRETPDRIFVWNERQRQEAIDLHSIRPERIEVTGAQLFDRWFDRSPIRSQSEFSELVGLSSDRPFLLFTGSSIFISRSSGEVEVVRRWVEAIRHSGMPEIEDIPILVRPHPYNTEAWENVDLADLGEVAVYPRQRPNLISENNRQIFFESLYYSAAVVGVNTSAMIEAAIIGRPVLSVRTPEFERTQEGTIHFHYLLKENGGCVTLATNFEEHLEQLRQLLVNPDVVSDPLEDFVRSFVRPQGLELPATPILSESIRKFAREPNQRNVTLHPLGKVIAQPILLCVGAAVAVAETLIRSRWGVTGSRTRMIWHRSRKRAKRMAHHLVAVPSSWARTRKGAAFVQTSFSREMKDGSRRSLTRLRKFIVRRAIALKSTLFGARASSSSNDVHGNR